MFPPYSTELAHHYCLDVISKINNGQFLLKQVAKESLERKNQGVMIGTLVCWNQNKKQREVLVAVSGIAKKLEIPKSFINVDTKYTVVPDIANAQKISEALQKNDFQIHQLTYQINDLQKSLSDDSKTNSEFQNQITKQIQTISSQRTKLTDASLKKVFSLYKFTSINHKKVSLNQIIKERNGKLPPTGTGDCCAPKLLSYAFQKKLIPVSLDEVYYGQNTKNKENGKSYPPCDDRCSIILPHLLGLKILYVDSQIIVVDKPSMLLSVPGKTEDKQDCVVSRVKTFIPNLQIQQPSVHRLDMETSGIFVLALTENAHKNLSQQFATQKVQKKYEAVLDGIIEKSEGECAPKKGETEGELQLKFRVDLENRPHQIYDEEYGLLGITKWKKLGLETYIEPITKAKKKVTRIEFIPVTGRTHQLRLAASHKKGLGLPIIGDSLYGTCNSKQRLLLHAKELSFYHPTSNKLMHFQSKPEF